MELTYNTEVIDMYNPYKTHWYVKATAFYKGVPIATAHIIPWGEFMPDMIKEAEDEAIRRVFMLANKYVLRKEEKI